MDVEAEARELGWVPKDQFRGDPEKWIDADIFVARGKEVMPILRKNNERLMGKVNDLEGSVTSLQSALKEAQDSLDAMRTYNESVAQKAYEKAVRDLKEQRKEALKENDGERVVVIEEALEQLEEQRAEVPTNRRESKTEAAPPPATEHPDFVKWREDNSSWLADPEKQSYAMAMAQYLRSTTREQGRKFLDMVTAEVEKKFGGSAAAGKVEGGSVETRGSKKTFADLPSDAQAACDRMAQRLVGPNRAYKTLADWRKSYAANYDWN